MIIIKSSSMVYSPKYCVKKRKEDNKSRRGNEEQQQHHHHLPGKKEKYLLALEIKMDEKKK